MKRKGSEAVAATGVKMTVWSFTPSRIGIMTWLIVNPGAAEGCCVEAVPTTAANAAAVARTHKKTFVFGRRGFMGRLLPAR